MNLKLKLIASVGFFFGLISNQGCNDQDNSFGINNEDHSQALYCNSTEYHQALAENPDLNLLNDVNSWLRDRSENRKTIRKSYRINDNLKYGKMDLLAIVTKTYQTDVWYYFVYKPQEEFTNVLPEIYVEGLDCTEHRDIVFPYTTNSTKFWHFDAMTAIELHFLEGADLGWLDQKFEI